MRHDYMPPHWSADKIEHDTPIMLIGVSSDPNDSWRVYMPDMFVDHDGNLLDW